MKRSLSFLRLFHRHCEPQAKQSSPALRYGRAGLLHRCAPRNDGLMVLLVLVVFGVSQPASALRLPRPLATDNRIYQVQYSPNEIYKFVGHYGYQSSIELAPDETISTISIGDSVAWSVSPNGSRIFLKPVEPDALTNMTVITDKRVYHFELHPKESDNINDKDMMFVLRFQYPEGEIQSTGPVDALPDLSDPEKLAKYNFNYTMTGADDVAPIRIFDDGEFTYFEFRDKNAEVPAFFVVDPKGNESLINFRTRGDYIIVERVATRFTLRHGAEVVCVYNETRPYKTKARGDKSEDNKKPVPVVPAAPRT